MKKLDLILLVLIGYGITPFAGIISAIWPIFGNVLLFTCFGIVLFMAARHYRTQWMDGDKIMIL